MSILKRLLIILLIWIRLVVTLVKTLIFGGFAPVILLCLVFNEDAFNKFCLKIEQFIK